MNEKLEVIRDGQMFAVKATYDSGKAFDHLVWRGANRPCGERLSLDSLSLEPCKASCICYP